MDSIGWLQQWYLQQCDGTWEHQNGIIIETLDNPGWVVKISLIGTEMQGMDMEAVHAGEINNNGMEGIHDWLRCNVDSDLFVGAGGPASLPAICDVFRNWVELKRGTVN
jgi:hypothetical protein